MPWVYQYPTFIEFGGKQWQRCAAWSFMLGAELHPTLYATDLMLHPEGCQCDHSGLVTLAHVFGACLTCTDQRSFTQDELLEIERRASS
jgi:hypothetical protein